jgi:hypothetical protein
MEVNSPNARIPEGYSLIRLFAGCRRENSGYWYSMTGGTEGYHV